MFVEITARGQTNPVSGIVRRDLARWFETLGWWARAAIAATGSLCMGLASPPSAAPWLVWLGFVPLMLVARTTDPKTRAWVVFAVGWGGGLCTGLVGFPWIAETLTRFAEFPAWLAFVGLFVFASWTAVPFGLWMLGVVRGPRHGVAGLLWPGVLWVGITQVWPALFPYTPVIGLAATPVWLQAAELGGVALVEMQVILVGVLAARGLLASQLRTRVGLVAAVVGVPLVSAGLGTWRMAHLDRDAEGKRSVRVGIIQPNTPLLYTRRAEKMRRLSSQSEQAQAEGAELIVWPEAGIYPFVIERPWLHDFTGRRQVLRRHQLPTILGVATRDEGARYEYNSVVAMSADGEIVGRFDKTILVPFGEYIPVVDPDWARRQIPAMSHNFAGEAPARFKLDLLRGETVVAGPLVCYEDIFPGFAREVAVQDGGIDLFANVTIDTWFGDTAEPREHLALAQFRSVEHRIPLVRSVAAGGSSIVDHNGRVVASLPVHAPTPSEPVPAERLVWDVVLPRNTEDRPTVFAVGGWLLSWLCLGAAVVVPLAGAVRRKYSPRAPTA